VIAPRHDAVRGDNVVLARGAPSRVTAARLDEAKRRFGPLLSSLPRPLVAVLLGGRTRHHPFAAAEAKALGERLAALVRAEGAGLAVTASRRTPPESLAALRMALGATPHYLYDGTGDNPYFGLLALADAIVVTADSVNMISDAASTGRPALVARLQGRPSRRFARFLGALEADGVIRHFEGRLERYDYVPLADAAAAAAELRRRWAARLSN
jgi:mitochondrial fission protein ELM1